MKSVSVQGTRVARRGPFVVPLEPRRLLSAWYVSARGGSDGNPGTLGAPFLTIQRAADAAQPGDTVFIRTGTYHETVTPPRSGTAGAPITFEPFGKEVVTIDGADPVGGISAYTRGVDQAPVTGDLGNGINQVFFDGQMLTEARWPNVAFSKKPNVFQDGFARATAVSTPTSDGSGLMTATISVPQLQDPPGAWVGATIHIAPGQEWLFQSGTVTASAPGSLTYTYKQLLQPSYEMPSAGNRFFLTGKMTALDAPGEWYLDSNSSMLFFAPPKAGSLRRHVVELKHRQYAFDLSGVSYVDVVGLHLFASTINTDANSSHILLDGLQAQYVSQRTVLPDPWQDQYSPHTTGIILNGAGNVLQDSVIQYSSGDGVFLGGSGNTVQNCLISETDYAAGDEAGITTMGAGERVIGNTLLDTARSGIVIRYSPGVEVRQNRISNFGLLATDLGGIYAFNTDGQNAEIAYNQISDSHSGGFGSSGIYLDNKSRNYVLHHNLVWNTDYGLKLNPPSHDIRVYNNTFLGTQGGLNSSGNETSDMAGSVFENNIFSTPAPYGIGSTQSNNLVGPSDDVFVNVRRHKYQLRKRSSAIDAGVAVPPFTDGFVGAAPDLGAFEYGGAAPPAGSSLALHIGRRGS